MIWNCTCYHFKYYEAVWCVPPGAQDSSLKLWDLRKLKNFKTITLDNNYEVRNVEYFLDGTSIMEFNEILYFWLCIEEPCKTCSAELLALYFLHVTVINDLILFSTKWMNVFHIIPFTKMTLSRILIWCTKRMLWDIWDMASPYTYTYLLIGFTATLILIVCLFQVKSLVFDQSGTYLAVGGSDIRVYICKQWSEVLNFTGEGGNNGTVFIQYTYMRVFTVRK